MQSKLLIGGAAIVWRALGMPVTAPAAYLSRECYEVDGESDEESMVKSKNGLPMWLGWGRGGKWYR